MSDEQAPPEGTPEVPASPEVVEAPGSEQVSDWQKRYDDLRPHADRVQSQLTQYEQLLDGLKSDDPEVRQQAAQGLGLELADETPQSDDDELPYVTRDELKAFQQELASQRQQEEQLQQVAFLESNARQSMKDQGVPEHLQDWVLDRAITQQYATDDGRVDVGKAYKEFTDQIRVAEQKEWAQSKRAPHVSPVGTEGTQAPKLDSHQDRVDYIKERLNADA